MALLLHIESSPRKGRSASINIASSFIDEYLKTYPGDAVDTIDLWSNELTPFDGDTINAKYAILHGEKPSDAQMKTWKPVEILIDHFKSAEGCIQEMASQALQYSFPLSRSRMNRRRSS